MSDTPALLITTHLQMTSPQQFVPAAPPAIEDIAIRRLGVVDVRFYLFMYQAVGEAYRWRDRLLMPTAELAQALAGAHIHLLTVGGVPAGYIELQPHPDHSVEVAYFGLRPEYHGRGLGKYLLSYGIEQAWALGPTRLTVHTCNLDGPYALPTYQARGFSIERVEQAPMPARYA